MARRPFTIKPVKPYLYDSPDECEEAEATRGFHLAEVKMWPPARSRTGEANPVISSRCSRCGCHLLVYGDNDPEQSGIEVKMLEKDAFSKKAIEKSKSEP